MRAVFVKNCVPLRVILLRQSTSVLLREEYSE